MTKVKICGIRRPEDVDIMNGCRPDFVGFVFVPSRRQVGIAEAAKLRERLHPAIVTVGVFVNQPIEEVAELIRRGIVSMVQLHGDEDEDYITRLQSLCRCPVIRAVAVGDSLPELPRADYLLFDTASAQRGGTGKAFDWELLQGYDGPPSFIAGGLTASNVAEAIRLLQPFAVDVSSGVERDGWKDPELVREFIRQARGQ